MEAYYRALYCSEKEYQPYGIAYAPEDTDIFLLPESGKELKSWLPISLELKDGIYADYLANDVGGRLCSEKLKSIIDKHLSEDDSIQWLEVEVKSNTTRELKKYFFLHFPQNFDILDKTKTIWVGDMVVKPVLKPESVKNHNIVTYPSNMGIAFFVSDEIKSAIKKEKITGLDFSKVL